MGTPNYLLGDGNYRTRSSGRYFSPASVRHSQTPPHFQALTRLAPLRLIIRPSSNLPHACFGSRSQSADYPPGRFGRQRPPHIRASGHPVPLPACSRHRASVAAGHRARAAMARAAGPLQELLGRSDVKTTMLCTHVLNRGRRGVRSPLDRPERLARLRQRPVATIRRSLGL